MHWKLVLTLVIIAGITGLLLFSEKGRNFREKYLEKYIKIVGGYLTGMTSRFKPSPSVNRTLSVNIEISSSGLKKQEFNLAGKPLIVELKYESVFLGDQNIKLKDKDAIDFETESMTGMVSFNEEGKMTISGSANSVELNEMIFLPQSDEKKIEFNLIGTPSSFALSDFEIDKITLSEVTGLLKLSNWSPLALQNDNLDISYFKGSIQQKGNTINIVGNVERISLNGIDLSLKT